MNTCWSRPLVSYKYITPKKIGLHSTCDLLDMTEEPSHLLPNRKGKPNRKPPPPPRALPNPLVNAEYTCSNGFRRVTPYWHVYLTNVKERWRGMKLIDVFTSEYRDREKSYYEKAILTGFITVNGQKSDFDHVVRNGDVIEHKMHRHEPPVPDKQIGIVHRDEDYLVIDKPSGIPVHAAGRFRHNSIVHILNKEYVETQIFPCNRLDRLTSGLMFLAFSPIAAEQMRLKLLLGNSQSAFLLAFWTFIGSGYVECNEPMMTVEPKLGLNRVHYDGKTARTVFKRIHFDGKYSIVLCKPLTGRTHQLRVHLQWLGHSISNDPIYSDPWVWGEEMGKHGAGDTMDIVSRLSQIGKTAVSFTASDDDTPGGERWSGENCMECDTPLYTDPSSGELQLYLHAWEYTAQDKSWSYRSPLPTWADAIDETALELEYIE
ncbi:hypothetical protein NEOLI_001990 [Neolecta irregularis DAH-3]|uniref:Pseudouridine synthase n=1 Tax=Neolecta irregularis (strain DAH-3) TaxID=1198029 RepID=A0A1U7LX12_NEOID|nr:hypothetical protein NEOLI_001990 [Neolecta irregularis DAH-3]|eukprot:OLL27061.1 hypothetical protein NEOLI_001990 [Neolecta irregularis DAH-3]